MQEDVEHVGVGLLNLVEEHYGVGLAAHSLGELSALIITDVARRCTDESGHGELLLILAHVDTGHQAFVVEKVVGQGTRQLRLTHTCGTKENERPDRALGVLHAGTAAAHGTGYGRYGFVLPDDTAMKLLFEVEQLVALALEHLAHRDTCPAAHYISNIIGSDLLLDEGTIALLVVKLLLRCGNLCLHLFEAAIAYLGHTTIVTLALSTVGLYLELLYELFLLLYLIYEAFLGLPLLREAFLLGTQLLNLLFQLSKFGLVFFALDSLALNLQLLEVTGNLVQLLRHRVALHTQLGSSLIHEVNGLVGEEALGYITARKLHGCHDGLVLDTYLMVVLVALLESAKNGD